MENEFEILGVDVEKPKYKFCIQYLGPPIFPVPGDPMLSFSLCRNQTPRWYTRMYTQQTFLTLKNIHLKK